MPAAKKSSSSKSASSKASKSPKAGSAKASTPASKKPAASKASPKKTGTTKASSTTKSKAAGSAKKTTGSRSKATSTTKKTSTVKSVKRAKPTPSKRKTQKASKSILTSAVEAVTGLFSANENDAVQLLKTDHRNVEELFEKVKQNEDGNNAATFKKIKAELDVHAHIEELILYPHLLEKGDKELKKIVREGIEEHTQVKVLLTEISELAGDSPTFKAKLKVLMENVEHHVKEEENEMFPMVEDQISAETRERLGSLMEGEKRKVQKMTSSTRPKQKAAAARR